jgi:hypothetical protein
MEKEITLVLNYLDKVGEKLGIGANMLWPYLMKQQIIEAYLNIIMLGIMFSLCFFTWKRYSVNPQRHADKWVDGMYVYIVTMGVTAFLGVSALARFVFHGIFQMINTEYMAFNALVDLLKHVK